MTFPDSCLECRYYEIDAYSDETDGVYIVIGCGVCHEWVTPELWWKDILPDWCPLKEMWRR